jgi:hypothetical protein
VWASQGFHLGVFFNREPAPELFAEGFGVGSCHLHDIRVGIFQVVQVSRPEVPRALVQAFRLQPASQYESFELLGLGRRDSEKKKEGDRTEAKEIHKHSMLGRVELLQGIARALPTGRTGLSGWNNWIPPPGVSPRILETRIRLSESLSTLQQVQEALRGRGQKSE